MRNDYTQVLKEYDDSDSTLVSYTYGDDLISQKRGSLASFYHYDGQLSTRQLSDASGQITDTYTYDAFGLLLARSGSTENNYLYTGEQYDPNVGFYYLRARYYNPSVGRFLTQDTWPGMQFEPMSLHKYLYCESWPVGKWDPNGEMTLQETAICTSILGSALMANLYLRLTSPGNAEGYEFSWKGYAFWVASGAAAGYGMGYLGYYAWIYFAEGAWMTTTAGSYVASKMYNVSTKLSNRWVSFKLLKSHFDKHAAEFKPVGYDNLQQYAADASYIMDNPIVKKVVGETTYYLRWYGTYKDNSQFGVVIEKGGKIVSYGPRGLKEIVELFPDFIIK